MTFLHFFDRDLEHQYPEKLLFGGITSALVIVIGGVVAASLDAFVFRVEKTSWLMTVAALAMIGAVLVVVAAMAAQFHRTHMLGRIPVLCLLATVLATVAIGLAGAATQDVVLLVALLVLPIVAVSLFGDESMLVIEWVVAMGVAAVALASIDGTTPWSTMVILAIVFGAIEVAIAQILRFMAWNLRVSESFRDLDHLIDETMSSAQALHACLDHIADASTPTRAVALVGVPERGFRVMLEWPAAVATDDVADLLATDPDVAEVARTALAQVRDDWAIMPVGYSDEGSIIVAMERSAAGSFAAVREVPYEVLGAALTKVSLRISSLQRLHTLSNTDPLTGLYNRRALLERLTLETEHADRDARSICVAMLDLDHFKAYNDTYGHLAGDEVLKVFGQVLRQRLRRVDSPARYGGEEFCLVLPDIELPDALGLLQDLRVRAAELDLRLPVTFSAGVARYQRGETVSEFIGRADDALYDAKERGRDQVATAAEAPEVIALGGGSEPTTLSPAGRRAAPPELTPT